MPRGLLLAQLKLQHLKMVVALSECGSMAKAAKQLAISQPVVSKGIAELESVLGVRLFERSAQGVEPTRYGRALLKRSIAIFDDLKSSVEEITFLADPTKGELRVGGTEAMLAGFGTAVMERLTQDYPRISLRVVQTDSETLVNRELAERRIDLALVPLLRRWDEKDFRETILFYEHLHVVVGLRSPWASKRKVTLKQLLGEPWCIAPSPVGSVLADIFSVRKLPMPRIAVSTVSPHLIMRMVETGRFIGHVNRTLLYAYANRFAVKSLPIELPVKPYPIAILTLKHRVLTPAAQLFIDCAQDVARHWREISLS